MSVILNKLNGFDTTTLSDALDALGLPGAIAHISPVTVKKKICGVVKTIRLGPQENQKAKFHLGTTAIASANSEHVLFVDNQGRRDCSSWGGLLSLAAQKSGVRGVISYGLCRDIDEIKELGFPIYALGATPISARTRAMEIESGGTFEVDGVLVSEGDYVVADQSGVVVIAKDKIHDVLEKAKTIQTAENKMAEKLKTSTEPQKVLGANYDKLTERK